MIYEYECKKCGEFELDISPALQNGQKRPCPKCHQPCGRVYSLAGLHFKGAGFYVNDYGKGSNKQ